MKMVSIALTFELLVATTEVEIPIDTWLFLIIPLLFVILVTLLYLYLTRGKND